MIASEPITVAVTGSTGFIGTKVAEYLTLTTPARTVCGTRSFSALRRIAELPQQRMRFVLMDVLDRASLDAAFEGCDVVVHCAFGNSGTEAEQWPVTVDGTRNVVDAARRSGVTRFVHLSTAAVRKVTASTTTLDRSTPYVDYPVAWSYEAAKLEAERIVASAVDLDPVILQPAIVYGPWGRDWTTRALQRLLAGVRGLPTGDASGLCNAVFVDDVARAAVAACWSPPVPGPVLIASEVPVLWGHFYDRLRSIVGWPPASPHAPEIEEWESELYAQRASVDITAAASALGWRPVVGFEAGMDVVGEWVSWGATTFALDGQPA